MPRFVKGAKWAYGWVVVGARDTITIPPQAWQEFGFQVGCEAMFLPGSRRSGGFSISSPTLMRRASERLGGGTLKEIGRGQFGPDRRIVLPPETGMHTGERLLAVRGSCYGLGFVAQGPIFQEALKHPDLVVFGRQRVTMLLWR